MLRALLVYTVLVVHGQLKDQMTVYCSVSLVLTTHSPAVLDSKL